MYNIITLVVGGVARNGSLVAGVVLRFLRFPYAKYTVHILCLYCYTVHLCSAALFAFPVDTPPCKIRHMYTVCIV